MKVLFVDPPMQSIMLARADWYPMSLAYLAGAVKQEGHEPLIYNAEHDPKLDYASLTTYSANYHLYTEALQDPNCYAWKRFRKVMQDFGPDVLGITSFSVKIPSALTIAAIAKDINPDIPIIVGGQHATIMSEQVLEDPNIDFVARGEGEETIVEFLRELNGNQNWGKVDGLCYMEGKKFVQNNGRRLIRDLDEIPFPSRESLYDLENYDSTSLAKLFSTRGCPYQCNYCGTQNIWTHQLRLHSPERVVQEIKDVKSQFGSTHFTFFDDVFGIHKKWAMKLLKHMQEEDLGINWDCLTRANLVSDELLSNMKKAGCKKIDMGVESGSDKILIDTQKGVTVDQITKGAKLVQKHGIFLYMFFMIGLPTETEEDVEKTKAFLLKMKPDWAGISIFTPIPGTGQYNSLLKAKKIKLKPDYAMFSHQSPHSNFAYNMNERDQFPKLAQDMLEFVENYNGSWRNLLRRAMTRGYHKNPKLLLFDLKKLASWKGIMSKSHQGSHAALYDSNSQSS